MKHPAPILISLLVMSVLAATPALARQAAEPAAPVVHSGAEAPDGLEVVHLEEMWRAGGEDDEIFFGHVFRAEGDADGNVYLLDTQLSEVPVFSPDGEHVKTLSREGEGPGESRGPAGLSMLPDGNLGILQRFPGTIVKIDLDGTPQGKYRVGEATEGGFHALYTARCKGEHLMMVGQDATMGEGRQDRTWFVSRFDAEGRELDRLWTRDSVIDFTNPVINELDILDPCIFGSTVGPDGRIYLAADHDRYAINVYGLDGALSHVIEREFTPRDREDRETGRIQAVFDVWASRNPGVETHVEPHAASIANLHVDDDNNLWVENSRSGGTGPAEAFLTFDVFDPDGHLRRQVALVCEGDPLDDRLFWTRDDMVVLVKGAISAMFASMADGAAGDDEEAATDEMEVVCYRVPR